jgi:hypothetical protein
VAQVGRGHAQRVGSAVGRRRWVVRMGDAPIGPADTERARTLWFALLLTLTNGFMDAHTFFVRGVCSPTSSARTGGGDGHVWPILSRSRPRRVAHVASMARSSSPAPGGALIGAFASRAWGAHAIWLAAGILAVTLVLFIVDERVLR